MMGQASLRSANPRDLIVQRKAYKNHQYHNTTLYQSSMRLLA